MSKTLEKWVSDNGKWGIVWSNNDENPRIKQFNIQERQKREGYVDCWLMTMCSMRFDKNGEAFDIQVQNNKWSKRIPKYVYAKAVELLG